MSKGGVGAWKDVGKSREHLPQVFIGTRGVLTHIQSTNPACSNSKIIFPNWLEMVQNKDVRADLFGRVWCIIGRIPLSSTTRINEMIEQLRP